MNAGSASSAAVPPVPPRSMSHTSNRWPPYPSGNRAAAPATHPSLFLPPQYPSFYSPYSNHPSQMFPPSSMTGAFGLGSSVPGLQMLSGIESFVHSINSVASLFENSYFALSNSFRAVLTAGDQLTNLRQEIWKILRAVSLIKGMKWVVQQILVFLRLRKPPSKTEQAWREGKHLQSSPKNSNLSGLLFFAFVIGGPWLLYKILKGNMPLESESWMQERAPHYVARAKYDFVPVNDDEVELKRGQKVIVATSNDYGNWQVPPDWLLVSTNDRSCGLAPGSYLELVKNNSNMQYYNNYQQSTTNFDDKFEIM